MDADAARTVVKVVSILHYASAGLSLLFALLFIVLMPFAAQLEGFGDLAAAVSGMIAAFLLLMAAVDVLIGYGLWNLRNWGRILLIVVYWLVLAFGVFMTVGYAVVGDWIGFINSLLFWIGISVVVLWLFQFDGSITALFTGQPQAAIKKK